MFIRPRLSAAFASASLVAAAVVLGPARPARAADGWSLQQMVGAINSAYDFIGKVDRLVTSDGPTIAEALARARTEILREIQIIRNDDIEAQARGLITTFQELAQGMTQIDGDRMAQFFNDSAFVLSHMKAVLTERDVDSSYELAPTYDLLVSLRAAAMKEAGYAQASFDFLFNEAKFTDHRVVGARLVQFDTCFFGICHWNTVLMSKIYEKQSNYWFKVPPNPFCSCNVWENRCKPTGAEGRCILDYTPLIPPERERIIQRYDADPVVNVIRTSLNRLVGMAGGRVLGAFGNGTIQSI